MLWQYLYELIHHGVEDPGLALLILAYVEKCTAVDTISFVLDLVSEAKRKGLGLEDLELVLKNLYSSLKAEKQLLMKDIPVFSMIHSDIMIMEQRKASKLQVKYVKEPESIV